MSRSRPLSVDAKGYGQDPNRTATEVMTPEGVVLPFVNAQFGERLGALVLDLLFQGLLIVVILIVFLALPLEDMDADHYDTVREIFYVSLLIFFFFLRSGYFLFFEMGRRGATPGKRLLRLRVIAHDGGQLTPGMVFTRNALREVELGLPLTLAVQSAAGQGGYLILGALIWTIVLCLLPLFNRQHARLGDFLGGTRVVYLPKASLSYDLADPEADRAMGLVFTSEQLVYGEMELQVLETVLRERRASVMRTVADRIKDRIGWAAPADPLAMPSDEHFLRAYYAALRAHLEGRMLLGKRRKTRTQA